MKIFEPIPDTKRAKTRKTSGARSKTRSPSMKGQNRRRKRLYRRLGSGHSHRQKVLTMVERKNAYALIGHVKRKTANGVLEEKNRSSN